MGVFNLILLALETPIHPTHAYRIAFMLITTAVVFNILNIVLLRQKVFKLNQRLTKEDEDLKKEIKTLKCRLRKYEEDCAD